MKGSLVMNNDWITWTTPRGSLLLISITTTQSLHQRGIMRNREKLDYYKIQVKKMKFRANDVAEDGVFLSEGDTLLGYAKHPPRVGKYMDVWFSSDSFYEDRENYITLGRVTKVEKSRDGDGLFVVTKLGRFTLTGGQCGLIAEKMASNHHVQ